MAPSNNIFFTYENFALSLPLFAVCGTYAYFKFIPLEVGVPILAVLFGLFKIHSLLQSRRSEKLQNLDESMVRDLAGDEDEVRAKKEASKAAKKQSKRNQELRQRLANERKSNNGTKGAKEEEEEDDDALHVFANKSKGTKKK